MPNYTSATEIDQLAGTVGVDLRVDDGTEATLVAAAVDYAGGEIDFGCQGRFDSIDQIDWVRNVATHFALEWLCLRRLNSVSESLAKTCDRYRDKLELIQIGKAVIPGAARSRRPVSVTNQVVDLRRANNQVRTDRRLGLPPAIFRRAGRGIAPSGPVDRLTSSVPSSWTTTLRSTSFSTGGAGRATLWLPHGLRWPAAVAVCVATSSTIGG